jgi:ABC-type transport system involved in multi-copper enzyme maturation permease subunit
MAFRAAEYERFSGERSSRPTWIPIATATLARGWASKWVRRMSFLSLLMGFTIVVLLYILNQVLPDWREAVAAAGAQVSEGGGEWTIDAEFYLHLLAVFVNPFILILSLMFGHDLIASDLRTNAMEAYFSRPITPWSYLFGRTIAFVGFLMLATFGPIMLIWCGDLLFSEEGHIDVIASVPLGLFGALLLSCTVVALMVQAITILTRSAIWTNLVFLVVFVMVQGMGVMLWGITGNSSLLAIAYFQDTFVVCAAALGELDSIDSSHPPAALAFGVLIGLALLSFGILMRGLKRRSLLA